MMSCRCTGWTAARSSGSVRVRRTETRHARIASYTEGCVRFRALVLTATTAAADDAGAETLRCLLSELQAMAEEELVLVRGYAFAAAELTFLSFNQTFLSFNRTFLSLKLTFLSFMGPAC